MSNVSTRMCGVDCCALLALSNVYSLILEPREWRVQTNCSSPPTEHTILGKYRQPENMYKNFNSQSALVHIIRRGAAQHGGTSQALRIALTHIKIFHKPSSFCDFSFFSLGILFSPYAGDNMLNNLRDPSSDFFEINPISYLREETWGPCL